MYDWTSGIGTVVRAMFVTLVLGTAVTGQTTYYVDAAVSPGGLGTENDPFSSILEALSVNTMGVYDVTSGDTIMVKEGVYPDQFAIHKENTDGTGDPRNVKIIGYGNSDPIIGSSTPGSPWLTGPAITITGGQSTTCQLRNFIVQGWDQTTANVGAISIAPDGTDGSSPYLENVTFETNRLSASILNMGGALTIGAYCNPSIMDCHFEGNYAGSSAANPQYGGAIGIGAQSITATTPSFADDSMPRPLISDCTFINNLSFCRGGAIAISGGSPRIEDCVFLGNDALVGGGAIFCKMTNGMEIVNSEFHSNGVVTDDLYSGGAILASWTVDDDGDGGTDPDPIRITGCIFGSTAGGGSGNSAAAGGAVLVANADCTITHNRFLDNVARGLDVGTTISRAAALAIVGIDDTGSGTLGEALGITIDPDDDVSMTALVVNNHFAVNTFGTSAPSTNQSAVWVHSADATEHSVDVSVKFTNNTANDHGFASLLVEEGTPSGGETSDVDFDVENCILWDPGVTPQLIEVGSPDTSVDYTDSNEDFTSAGTGNLYNEDPDFEGGPEDFTLSSGSPCIDAGLNSYWYGVRSTDPKIPNVDLSGGTRINGQNGYIDMGCEEY